MMRRHRDRNEAMVSDQDKELKNNDLLEEDEVTEVGPTETEGAPGSSEPTESKQEGTESIADLRAQRDDYKDKFLRTYAEFDNFRKRTVREKEDLLKFGNEKLLREVLAIKDDLERASEHQDAADMATLKEGLTLIGRDLNKILTQFQVEVVETVGKPFDPTIHEAIGEQESTEHPKGTVLEEFQKGYTYHGRLLRAAKVLVAK